MESVLRNKNIYIFTVAVAILYVLMYLEHRYGLFFPYGTLIGRTLVLVFVPITILGFIAVFFAFRGALLAATEDRFSKFIILILISTAWFFPSMYYLSHNRLNMGLSIADELRGKKDSKSSLSSTKGRIYLESRGIRTIPPEIFKMTDLQSLSLQGNQIDHIGPEIAASPLISLQIYSNNLSSLPNELSMTQIKYLDLSMNRLTSFPDDFRFPATLLTLQLNSNQLTSLSNSLENCSSLEFLNLWGNQFSDLPDSLRKLEKLKSLSLVKNRFTEFPPVIFKLNNLNELGLAFNQIQTLPKELVDMKNLKSLNLSGNPIPIEQINEFRKLMPFCSITYQN